MKKTLPMNSQKPSISQSSQPEPARVIAWIFAGVLFVFGYQLIAAGGYNFFVWVDHLLGADRGNPPVFLWALAGAVIGAGAGAIVIWRKYHLQLKWCLAATAPVLLLLLLLELFSSPLAAIEPRPLAVVRDSTTATGISAKQTIAVTRRPHKRKRMPAMMSVAKPIDSVKDACAQQLSIINIHARSDSVKIYYRISMQRNGDWSSWRSKFVPQQGEFMLTEDGPVKANRIEYFYETGAVLTRSAQNPYTRVLCNEQLIIDTY